MKVFRALTALLLIVLSISTSLAAVDCNRANATWETRAEGLQFLNCKIDKKGSYFSGIRVDMAQYALHIAQATKVFQFPFTRRRNAEETQEGLERSLSDYFDFTVDELFEEMNLENAVVASVGYPELPGDPVPLGFLRSDKENVSALRFEEPYDKYLTAFLCIQERYSQYTKTTVSAPRLFPFDASLVKAGNENIEISAALEECVDAIQVGPRIVEADGEKGIKRGAARQSDRRSVFWIGKDGMVYLGYFSDIDLFTVQRMLLGGAFGASSKPLWAVNVSVREHAGFRFRETSVGEIESTNAAFLLFCPNDVAKESEWVCGNY